VFTVQFFVPVFSNVHTTVKRLPGFDGPTSSADFCRSPRHVQGLPVKMVFQFHHLVFFIPPLLPPLEEWKPNGGLFPATG
jgi:hypothetical protein